MNVFAVNSNYYAVDRLNACPTHKQSARAGQLVHAAFSFRRILHKQETAPVLVNNLIF